MIITLCIVFLHVHSNLEWAIKQWLSIHYWFSHPFLQLNSYLKALENLVLFQVIMTFGPLYCNHIAQTPHRWQYQYTRIRIIYFLIMTIGMIDELSWSIVYGVMIINKTFSSFLKLFFSNKSMANMISNHDLKKIRPSLSTARPWDTRPWGARTLEIHGF